MNVTATTGDTSPAPRCPTPGRPRELVLVLSTACWDAVCRRGYHTGDRLAAAILADPAFDRVLVVNPYRSAARRGVRWVLGDHGEPFPSDPSRMLLQPFRWRGHDPASVVGLERTYRAYGSRIRRAAHRAGLRRPHVLCLNPLAAGFADFSWAANLTFFAEDDFAAVGSLRPWRAGIEEAYRRLAASGAGVGAVTDAIIERIAPRGPAAVVPNGVERNEWWEPTEPPAWLRSLPGPRILYLGIPDDRIDESAVRQVALAHSRGSVIFVGGSRAPEHLAGLLAEPNVHFHPHVARAEIPGIVVGADVCIVPHRVTPLTLAMSPLKIYEYLAGGRSVVATDIAPMRGIDDRVTLVPAGGDFAGAVTRALARGPVEPERRRRFIVEHSWDRRVEEILALAGSPREWSA